MPFNLYASVFIPKENIPPEFLECMGFIEKEIRDFYKKNEVPMRVDTRHHDMKDIEFDEYEEVK
jgi:hypothetical protein